MPTAKLLLVSLVSALTGAAAMGAFLLWYFDPFAARMPNEEPMAVQSSSPGEAAATEAAAPSPATPMRSGGLVYPVMGATPAELIDSFGDPRGEDGERWHEGIDIMAPAGRPVVAVADGVVSDLVQSDAGGLTLYLRSGDTAYFYAHLSAYAPGLRKGQQVSAGQRLGAVGSTGNADTEAPHLHFEMRLYGPDNRWDSARIVNPFPYLTR